MLLLYPAPRHPRVKEQSDKAFDWRLPAHGPVATTAIGRHRILPLVDAFLGKFPCAILHMHDTSSLADHPWSRLTVTHIDMGSALAFIILFPLV